MGDGTRVTQVHERELFRAPGNGRTFALEREQQFVRTFNFLFGLQEFFAPWFARALGALVDRVADGEAVIAGPFGTGAGKLFTFLAGFEELAFEHPMLLPQFVLTDDAHNILLMASGFNITPSPQSGL
jgi:hypothetical protein